MSDDSTTPPTPDPTTPPPAAVPDLVAEVEKWKTMARKHEDAWKGKSGGIALDELPSIIEKAKKFEELEEASKSEQQKLAERATRAEAELAAAKAEAERAAIASAKGVPVELLSGSTREELEAAADRLLAFKGVPPKAPPAYGQGEQGPSPTPAKQLTAEDVKKLYDAKQYDEIEKARAEGLLTDLLG